MTAARPRRRDATRPRQGQFHCWTATSASSRPRQDQLVDDDMAHPAGDSSPSSVLSRARFYRDDGSAATATTAARPRRRDATRPRQRSHGKSLRVMEDQTSQSSYEGEERSGQGPLRDRENIELAGDLDDDVRKQQNKARQKRYRDREREKALDNNDPVLTKRRSDSVERNKRWRERQSAGSNQNQRPNDASGVLGIGGSQWTPGRSPLSVVTNRLTPTSTSVNLSDVRSRAMVLTKSGGKENRSVPEHLIVNTKNQDVSGGASSAEHNQSVVIDRETSEEMSKAKNRIRQREYRKRKREERDKATEGNLKDSVSTPQRQTVDTQGSGVTDQDRAPASEERLTLNGMPVATAHIDAGAFSSQMGENIGDDSDDSWLHRNNDWRRDSSPIMGNYDDGAHKTTECVTPEQLKRFKKAMYMKDYRKKLKEEAEARAAARHAASNENRRAERSAKTGDDDFGHHGNWEPDETESTHFGEEDLDASDPSIRYDVPVEDQDEEARLYGLRGMYL
ncbi:hypothetical protein EJB05_04223, partial [Eragrostis curvula]